MEKWIGKICLITGASAGIGADLCLKLANSGMIVIGLARRVEKIEELSEKVDESKGGKIYAKKCDVENESEILEAFKWVADEFKKIDVFINNAGVFISNFLVDSDSESYRKLFNVNVIAACICLREAVKLMKETSVKGHILIINSILGHRIPDISYPAFGVYPATKYSLTALSQTVRQELSFLKLPIKLTSVSPGMVDTDILQAMNQEVVSRLPKLNISDVTDAVLYALSTPDNVRVRNLKFKNKTVRFKYKIQILFTGG
jgi:NADP+-dependent farnesol dehydrogenase